MLASPCGSQGTSILRNLAPGCMQVIVLGKPADEAQLLLPALPHLLPPAAYVGNAPWHQGEWQAVCVNMLPI